MGEAGQKGNGMNKDSFMVTLRPETESVSLQILPLPSTSFENLKVSEPLSPQGLPLKNKENSSIYLIGNKFTHIEHLIQSSKLPYI